ncbi:TIGR03663 family protein [Methanosarcina mazei]|uniref:flippase activity-associated protein Agl23 n=1 Tax=Methanosarcina mazei TaxID=2209 RepID=UPI002553F9E8|nr:flippase activity-associated protein Agl23 [Methanosarcina mazei]WIM47540.1 TIGR03663 family protein [Methanosarcina mazei]
MQKIPGYENTNSEVPDKKYWLYGLMIVFFALAFRLFELGERVLHHDESIHASFTLKLLEHGEYSYDPAYHGPFLFHSTAAVFHFLGITDTTSRLVPVLFGVATILLLFLLKKELGKNGVLWSMFLLAFSPSMVYFSRFFRNDMIIIFCTLAAVTGAFRYLDSIHSLKRYPYLVLAASSLAVAVSSKENAYIILAVFGAYAGLGFLYWICSDWKKENMGLKETLRSKTSALLPYLPEIILSGALSVFIIMFFYSSAFRYDVSLFSIVERAFNHWMEMHSIERIGGPFYYYIPILLRYEIPVVLFGAAGFFYFLFNRVRNKGQNYSFFLFLCYWALTSLLLYSYIQEKVPWLVVHIVLPFGLLAGAFLGEVFSKKNKDGQPKKPDYPGKIRALLTVILVLTLLVFISQCISVNYYRSMEDEELITYTQASPDIRILMEKIEGFNESPDTLRIYVIDQYQLYWPLPWYLRDYERAAYSSKPPSSSKYDAIIAPISCDMYRELSEEEYSSYNFTLRPGRDFTLYYNNKLEQQ